MVYGFEMNKYRETYSKWRRAGRFAGRRVNCEYVPQLPASVAKQVIDDPRNIPYLLIWKNRDDGQIQEALRLRLCLPVRPGERETIEAKRTNGTKLQIFFRWRYIPTNGARTLLLFCWSCGKYYRSLYGWRAEGSYTSSARTCDWQCRRCAGLRYASEGGALVFRSRSRLCRLIENAYGPRAERPQPWHPYVFSSPDKARAAGVI